jgi:hypothetical protein
MWKYFGIKMKDWQLNEDCGWRIQSGRMRRTRYCGTNLQDWRVRGRKMTESYISGRKGQKGVHARPQTLIKEMTRMRIKTRVGVREATRVVTWGPRWEDKAIQVARRATPEMEGAIGRKQEGGARIRVLELNEEMYHPEFLHPRNRQNQRRTILRLVVVIQYQTLQHRLDRAKRELWDIILFLSMWK